MIILWYLKNWKSKLKIEYELWVDLKIDFFSNKIFEINNGENIQEKKASCTYVRVLFVSKWTR